MRGALLIPVHWGTFNLSTHDWREPAERVLAAARDAGVTVVLPRPGEPVTTGRIEVDGAPRLRDVKGRLSHGVQIAGVSRRRRLGAHLVQGFVQ